MRRAFELVVGALLVIAFTVWTFLMFDLWAAFMH